MQLPNHNLPIKSVCTTTNAATSDNPVFIVETYKNGSQWYRKYSDGVIEQGGAFSGLSINNEFTFNFVTPFTNPGTVMLHLTNIFAQKPSSGYRGGLSVSAITATNFTVFCDGYATNSDTGYWEARGV